MTTETRREARRPHIITRVTRRRLLVTGGQAAAGFGAASLLAACGSKKSSPGQTSTPTATAAGTPKRGGSVTVRIQSDPPNFSVFTASFLTAGFADLAYNKLLAQKVGPDVTPDQVVLEPDLAAAMPEQPDSTTYIFKLRPGVKWQNVPPANGAALTAQDVVDAVNAYRTNTASAFRSDYGAIDSVAATDAQTIKIVTKEPYAPLLAISAGQYGLRVFPVKLLENDAIKKQAVGTGPFILDSYQQGSRASYKRNPDYFRSDRPYLDAVTLAIIPQEASAISAFETGQADIIGSIPCVSADEVKRAKSDAKYGATYDVFPGGYIALNTTKAPFSDARVRRAVSMAFNRKAESDALECGQGKPDQLIPTGAWKLALRPDQMGDASKYWAYNPDEAKKLLAEAGFANGFEVSAVYTPQYGQAYQDSLARAASDFKAVGITVKPTAVQYNQWISSLYRPPFKFDGMLWGPSRYYSDPDPYVWYWLHPDPKQGISNQSRVNDPQLVPLLTKQRQTLDSQQRNAVLEQIEKIVADQQYYVGRTTGVAYTFWQPWIQGYGLYLGYDFPQLERIWDARR